MQCPSCGAASNGSTTCECAQLPGYSMETLESESPMLEACAASESQRLVNTPITGPTSRLIEFPGVSRSLVPGWRKEITERVREVQERRAREAAAEAAADEFASDSEGTALTPQLELLPQTETPVVNPLVTAALKRIERAHVEPAPAFESAGRPATAIAYAVDEDLEQMGLSELSDVAENIDHGSVTPLDESPVEIAKTHNLVVVPSPTISLAEAKTGTRRVIADDLNSPALNYLDSIETTIHLEDPSNRAPAFRRMVGGLFDLVIVALLCSPFAIGVELMQANWGDPQVIITGVSTAILVNFLYSTISTALTGRTLGMRLLQLRVVDARTGLIPTGKQSAGRALLYLASLFSAGIALTYALVDSEKRTAHDRFTQTAVIRV